MKYKVTAYLHDGDVVATIEADSFHEAIQAHRKALMKGRTARRIGTIYRLRRIVAVKDERP